MNIVPEIMLLPPTTLVGNGRVRELLSRCSSFGDRGVLIHGKSLNVGGALEAILQAKPKGLSLHVSQHCGGEPTLDQLQSLLIDARAFDAQWIAAVGGGSVLDIAKACAGLYHCINEPVFYHNGGAFERPGLPFIAVPTTAGTGSEATPNAVLTNVKGQSKKSIRDDSFTPRLVILDAELLKTCPKNVIACSGMDAFTQALEAFTSRKTTWLSDQFSLKGLTLVAQNLTAVFKESSSPAAKDLLTGSYLAGIGLSMARLGVVHGIAHPLGMIYHQPHGLVCAACLPHAITLNREAFGAKYAVISEALGDDLLNVVTRLNKELGIVSPFKGKSIPRRDSIIAEALASGSTAANPKTITAADIDWLLDQLF
jgi:alcohol dehydrogenase class IV